MLLPKSYAGPTAPLKTIQIKNKHFYSQAMRSAIENDHFRLLNGSQEDKNRITI